MQAQDPSALALFLEHIEFFGYTVGSVSSLAALWVWMFFKMYVRNALHEFSEVLDRVYVRRDVLDAELRALRELIGGAL